MSWLLTEIAVALIIAGLVGIGIGLLLAWTFAANTVDRETEQGEEQSLKAEIRSLKGQNERLRRAYAEDRAEQVQSASHHDYEPARLHVS